MGKDINTITYDQLSELRSQGTISENEIALVEGDMILAKNVLTLERRIVGKVKDVLTESNSERRILKD